MSLVTFVLTLVTTFAAIFLAVVSLTPARAAATVRASALVQRADISSLPLYMRLVYPFLSLLAPVFSRIGWETYRTRANRELQRAGIASLVTVDHLLGFKAICAIITPLFLSMAVQLFQNPAMFLLAGVGGFFLPDRLVGDLRKKRERAIVRALPGTVDVLSLSVEAGLEFLMAIQRVVERGGIGPLRDELATVLNDIRLGKSRAEALKTFAARVEIPEVSSFVSVLVQADQLGASIGPVLLSQGERMRIERFQRAEKEGARASQKTLFPLVLFIFPAVLIIIIGPVALQFIYGK
jgi:tight adherence protein C